jgi:hypothetical protein
MTLKSMVRDARRESLVWAGLFLAAAVGIQCTAGQGGKGGQIAPAASAKMPETKSPAAGGKLEAMAKSDPIALLELCLKHCRENYHDYTCLFEKQERMGGTLGRVQEVVVKYMDNPFSVSMHWVKNPPSKADWVLYVEGKWKNRMIVRPTGLGALAGPQFRPPDGADAMKETLKPVTVFGFERTLRAQIDAYTRARKNGELRQEFGGYAKVDGRNTLVLVRILPQKPGYLGWKTLTYIDVEYLTPVMLEAHGWDDKHLLTSRYAFHNVKFNVGLTAEDFLPKANGMVEPH